MSETVFDRIALMERYATKQEKVIIEFLRSHPTKDLLLLSITEFSEKAGVGDATTLRFCRKLGLRVGIPSSGSFCPRAWTSRTASPAMPPTRF